MPQKTQLIILASQPITLAAGDELPTRLKLMSWGNNPGAKGNFILNSVSAAQLPGNQLAVNFDRVPLDFEHNTVKGSESYKGEPCPVAGHGTPELIAGDGLYLNSIEWTDEGRKYVGGRHYIDLSPTILTNAKREVTLLHSAAVCRKGALDGVTILSADGIPLELLTANPTNTMKDRELLLKLLGLPAEATDAEIEEAAKALAARLDSLTTLTADLDALKKQIAAPAAGDDKVTLIAMNARLDDMAKKLSNGERLQILTAAQAAGKVVPKACVEGADALSNGQLISLVAQLPVTVPMDRRTPLTTPVAGVLETNSADDAVKKLLGLSDDEWKSAAR